MSKFRLLLFLLFWFQACSNSDLRFHEWVDPFIGTDGHGHTYPGASSPFGMVQLSPDTRIEGWDACSGYHFSDSTIIGFSHTHLSGTGAADYGDILFSPGYQANTPPLPFNHIKEDAWAGYYSVSTENGIKVKVTTTPRVGIQKITFDKDQLKYIAINLEHGIGPDHRTKSNWQTHNNNEIRGFRYSSGWAKDQKIYFVTRFSSDFTLHQQSQDSVKAVLEFNKSVGEILIKTGISAVSIENATANLNQEASHWDFGKYRTMSELSWDKELGKIDAEFLNNEDKTIFYTALYHSFLAPNLFSDINGDYRGFDGAIHKTEHSQYTVFSLWDTFRATHPLFTLVNPVKNVEMINSMLNMYTQGGMLPVWELAGNETGTMIGYHATPVIADAIMKDLPGFDYNLALDAMIHSAMQDHLGLKYYKEMGFIPAEKEHESVSKTLEYAYDDWCIATVAKKLGKDSIYAEFSRRAQYYKNMYDAESGFMRPRRNGNWYQDFKPFEVSGNYTEANAWQYSYFVPHDIDGLSTLFSPNSNLETRLDELFSADSKVTGRNQPDIDGMIGQYAHGNEPSHNFTYLYAWTNNPWKTQKLVSRISNELYTATPDGLSGNEDCGQMSSWYVLSALGFYPAVPGSNEYIFGSPKIKSATISLGNEKSLKIRVMQAAMTNIYIKSITLNGEQLDRLYITHSELLAGGELVITMTNKPVTSAFINRPYSRIESTAIATTPIIRGGEMAFLNECKITIEGEPGSKLYFTRDGTLPDSLAVLYSEPILIDETTTIRVKSYAESKQASGVTEATFIKIPYGRTIDLKNQYSHLYTGNSSMALIDHLHGGNNFRDGWQGYHEVDLDATVDLGKLRTVNEVNVGFLQDHYSWIFYPKWLEISFSINGKTFDQPIRIKNLISAKANGLITQKLGTKTNGTKARYVKVVAKNMGQCPDWHKGNGGKAWLFADEIEIRTENQ